MANLSVTTACNRDCAYCFARAERGAGTAFMSLEVFEKTLKFLERSGINEVRLLGGEPTLHPDFPLLVDRVLDRGWKLRVFSNGLMPERALQRLGREPADRITVLVNIGATDPRQTRTLRRLGERISLGFTADSPSFDLRFLIDLILDFGLSRGIRLGLAHPSADGSNRFLHPRYYAVVGERLVAFGALARVAGIELSFDCGFVPCMFPPGGLEQLGPDAAELGLRCSPILDVLPAGDVIHCYPLAGMHREPLPDREDAAALRKQFLARVSGYRRVGVFRECAACVVRANGHCAGGCLAAAMYRLRQVPREAEVPRREPVPRWVVPYIDQPLAFWERLEAEIGQHIREVYFPIPHEGVGSGRPPQPAEHLTSFLKRSTLPRSVLINPIVLPRPADEIAPAIIETLKRLMNDYDVSSATLSNLLLAARIRETLPTLRLTASALMDVAHPNQVAALKGICETLVPSSRVMRDLPALEALRAAFPGRIRLIVNEACLPGCPYRVQHFYEMSRGVAFPESLCVELLEREPWMRLTGAWVLPQHLHLFDKVCDEWKLAGRVTLRDAARYRRVLGAYVRRSPLVPHEIGGGPASPLFPMEIEEEFYAHTLRCGKRCHECNLCRDYYEKAMEGLADAVRHGELKQIRMTAAN